MLTDAQEVRDAVESRGARGGRKDGRPGGGVAATEGVTQLDGRAAPRKKVSRRRMGPAVGKNGGGGGGAVDVGGGSV